MKIRCKASVLSEALGLAEKACEKKLTIPILGCVDILAEESVTMRTTDLAVSLSVGVVGAEVLEAGRACVKIQLLLPLVRTMTGDVELSTDQDDWMRVTCPGSKHRIMGFNPSQFPDVFEPPTTSFYAPAAEVKKMVSRVAVSAAARGDFRYRLSGALLLVNSGVLAMVSTDTHRLSHATLELPEVPHSLSIDSFVSSEAFPIIEALPGEKIGIGEGPSQLFFVGDGMTLWIRKVTGNYPNWRAAFPSGPAALVSLRPSRVVDALRRLLVTAPKMNSMTEWLLMASTEESLEATPASITISTRSPEAGESEEALEATSEGLQSANIVLNGSYLLDFFSRAEGDDPIVAEFRGPLTVLLLSAPGWKHLIMPINIKHPLGTTPKGPPAGSDVPQEATA